MGGYTNKEVNRSLGISKVSDVVKRPAWINDEIKIQYNPLSAIPPAFRHYYHCSVCLQMFEFDTRRHKQFVQCYNNHVHEVDKDNFGKFKYRYRPDVEPSKKTKHQLDVQKMMQAVQCGKRSMEQGVWNKDGTALSK